MVWCQATTHYHSQCWIRSMSPYVVIKLWWVNYICIAITCNQYDEIPRLITVRHARLYVRCTVSLELSTSSTLVRTVECPLWSYIACFRKVSMVELQQVVWYKYIHMIFDTRFKIMIFFINVRALHYAIWKANYEGFKVSYIANVFLLCRYFWRLNIVPILHVCCADNQYTTWIH